MVLMAEEFPELGWIVVVAMVIVLTVLYIDETSVNEQ